MGWISVKDRLPDDDSDVLVYCVGGNGIGGVTVGFMHDKNMFVDQAMDDWELPVTHWMPLPSPPED